MFRAVQGNAYMIGQRVSWDTLALQHQVTAGVGFVDAIYTDGLDRLTYRVEREGTGHQNRYVLLHEDEMQAAPAAEEQEIEPQ
jgi:hypothetical protein